MVRSHTQELLKSPRIRNACDRCHAQKLRCLKSTEGETCLRCAKFGSSCVYSARTKRRMKSRKPIISPSNAEANTAVCLSLERSSPKPAVSIVSDGAMTWLDPSLFAPQIPLDIHDHDLFGGIDGCINPLLITSQQPHSCNWSNSLQNSSMIQFSFDLVDLNTKLVDQQASLLSITSESPSSRSGSRMIALDQTFALTRRLLTTLEQFDVYSTHRAITLLFLSCYHRLIDLYKGLFEKMKLCTQTPHAIIPAGLTLNIPAMKNGSYNSTGPWKAFKAVEAPMTKYATHFMLFLLLCEGLCEELRDAVGRLIQSPARDTGWKTQGSEILQQPSQSSVDMLDSGGDEACFGQPVRNAMWTSWTELAEQIQATKKAAMVFAVACL